ncbi:MAG: hypothetical protein IVW53_16185 [Chloroflexi bacterium]|nr:hypothetical protein [Chloroflexota bacterium]
MPDLKLEEREGYNARYEKAKRTLGWDNSTVKDWIATTAGQTKPFSLLDGELQLYVVEAMEAEAEAGDIPFEFESPDELFPEETPAPAPAPAPAPTMPAAARAGGRS